MYFNSPVLPNAHVFNCLEIEQSALLWAQSTIPLFTFFVAKKLLGNTRHILVSSSNNYTEHFTQFCNTCTQNNPNQQQH